VHGPCTSIGGTPTIRSASAASTANAAAPTGQADWSRSDHRTVTSATSTLSLAWNVNRR
jgi:hypothetical protein